MGQPINQAGGTYVTTNALLTATGAETVYDTTVILQGCINGDHISVAAIANGVTPTTDGNTSAAFVALAASQGCYFVWAVDAADAVTLYQGNVNSTDPDDTGADPDFVQDNLLPQFPTFPSTVVPFAYQLVKNGTTGSAWTIGTSNWNATGIADLITNILVMPDTPQDKTTA